MRNFLIRLIISAAALWAAAYIVGGINFTDNSIPNLLYTAAIFGVVNALIRPVLAFVTCPLQLITLGAFTFVLNALMLLLTGRITGSGFTVDGFWAAFFGGLIVSLVSTVLSKWLIEPTETIEQKRSDEISVEYEVK